MEFKLETVMENVLWTLLLKRDRYINDIESGNPTIFVDQMTAIKDEVMANMENYFIIDKSIIVITTYEDAPDCGDIKIYLLNEESGDIQLLRTCNIDEPLLLIRNEYLTKRYRTHFLTRQHDSYKDGYMLAWDYANDTFIKIKNGKAILHEESYDLD